MPGRSWVRGLGCSVCTNAPCAIHAAHDQHRHGLEDPPCYAGDVPAAPGKPAAPRKPAAPLSANLRRVLSALRRYGLLLKQDKVLPSVVGLVTGEAVTGSCWSHPQAKRIFDLLGALAERPDSFETKLIAGTMRSCSKAGRVGPSGAALPWHAQRRARAKGR